MSAEITAALDRADELAAELRAALQAGDDRQVRRLLDELGEAERHRDQVIRRSISPGSRTAPRREIVARVLGLLGRPARVDVIRAVAHARWGVAMTATGLASLRRDEQRSWSSAAARPVYVVPALTYDRFVPVRGLLGLGDQVRHGAAIEELGNLHHPHVDTA